MMKIIDIHTHMLFGIDDGASDCEMSLELMGLDYEQGVSGIFLTNHSYGMEKGYKDYHKRFEKLSKLAGEKCPGQTRTAWITNHRRQRLARQLCGRNMGMSMRMMFCTGMRRLF